MAKAQNEILYKDYKTQATVFDVLFYETGLFIPRIANVVKITKSSIINPLMWFHLLEEISIPTLNSVRLYILVWVSRY